MHQLKGASGYVGAGRIHYVCYWIQNAFHDENHQKMLDYYPLLVEACIEFKRFSREYLSKEKGKVEIGSPTASRLFLLYLFNIAH